MQRNMSCREFGKRLAASPRCWGCKPAWNYLATAQSHTVAAAKAKFDPKNALTPGYGMFPG
jgi:hypothetical protein